MYMKDIKNEELAGSLERPDIQNKEIR